MSQLHWFGIHYRDREFAKVMDDPLLVKVLAFSKEQAEEKAYAIGIDSKGAGLWATDLGTDDQQEGA